MGMELNAQGFSPLQDAAIREAIRARDGVLRDTPDGPILDVFHPEAMAAALFQEIRRCEENGWSKVTLTMDVVDAQLLGRFLLLERRP